MYLDRRSRKNLSSPKGGPSLHMLRWQKMTSICHCYVGACALLSRYEEALQFETH